MIFNPETFMNATFTEVNDTRNIPCPAGEWHAHVTEVKAQAIEIKKGDRAGEVIGKLNIFWEIDDEQPRVETGKNKVIVRQEILLDLTPEGMLDFGKGRNIRLGKLREAHDLNTAGHPYNPQQHVGKYSVVVVGHRTDPDDSSIQYDEVKTVRKA